MRIAKPAPATAIDHKLADLWLERFGFDEPHACWQNSIKTMVCLANPDSVSYQEGWLTLQEGQFPIEHGWLEMDGRVIDLAKRQERAHQYTAVFRYSFDQVSRLVAKHRGVLPFYWRRKRDRLHMLDSFLHLPIDFNMAIVWATLGVAHTSIEQIYISREGREYLSPILDARWREQRIMQPDVILSTT